MRMIIPNSLVLQSKSLISTKSWLSQAQKIPFLFMVLFLLTINNISVQAQCPPGGTMTFTSQAEIDAFPATYPSCTILIGDVTIEDVIVGDITNLDSLIQLTSIGGNLTIYNNDALVNIDGLSNLNNIGGDLSVQNNDILPNLDGLSQVLAIDGKLTIQNNILLTSISGIRHIDANTITELILNSNTILSTCQVQTICDYLSTPGNANIVDNNAIGCQDSTTVVSACLQLANNCPIDILDISTSDLTCDTIATLAGPQSDCTIDSFSYTVNGVPGLGIATIVNDTTTTITDTFDLGTNIIEYYIEDCYGSLTCTQTLTVTDDTPPVVTCPPTVFVQCNPYDAPKHETIDEFIAGGGTVFDNCEVQMIIGYNQFNITGQSVVCSDTFVRNYYIYDVTGNQSTCDQTIIVSDSIAPSFDLPSDITINCTDDKDDLSITGNILNAFDNCGIQDTSYTDVIMPGTCPSNFIITRQWILTDSCSNADTLSQVISIVDGDAPTVLTKNDTIYLDAAGNASLLPTDIDNGSFDACGLNVILSIDKSDFTCADWGTNMVQLTVTDSCGNAASSNAIVTVLDIILPTATSPTPITDQCGLDNYPVFTTLLEFTNAGGTYDDNCSVFSISLFYEYSDFYTCPETITRTYMLSDIGGNTVSVNHIFTINDITSPVITCPTDITVDTDTGECFATIDIGLATATDNCSAPLNITNDKIGNVFDEGTHTVQWIVTDACGNADTCYQTIIVEDNEAPVLTINPALVIDLTIDGQAILNTGSFVTGVSENCGLDSIAIRRMDDNCGIPSNVNDGQELTFCCEDVTTGPHNVIITAWDIHGNSSSYMVPVTVQDKLIPTIVSCPTNVTINCEFPLNMNDLSVFGKMVTDPSLIEDIIINGDVVGEDGYVIENCPDQINIVEVITTDIECGQGVIYRTFNINDVSGIIVSCTQEIYIVDVDPFEYQDITWPNDTILETTNGNCDPISNGFDPDDFGKPSYTNDDCSLVGQTHEDVVTYYPNTGCKTITRKWKVIDWCQFELNTSTPSGIWEDIQIISVINQTAPIITSTCNDTILCSDIATCAGNNFNLTIDATDDCTSTSALFYSYVIDLNNDGTDNVLGNGKNANHYFKNGTHKITWSVNDRCGNISSCDYLFTVQDCKPPTPICLHGLAVNLVEEGSAVLWASDFNRHSYDNCTPSSELKFSFSSDINNQSRTYTCDSIGQREVELWVTDAQGNQSYCVTYVDIQDNLNICTDLGGLVSISGRVVTPDNLTLGGVSLNLTGPEINMELVTSADGAYLFEDLEQNYSYKIKPSMDGEDMFGISTLDLILIQRHILQLKEFASPYDLLAADTDHSGDVSVGDIIELRKVILGKIGGFSQIDSWRFVASDYNFDDDTSPWDCDEDIDFINLTGNINNSDFIAVKVGDVDGSVSNELKGMSNSQTRNKYVLNYDNRTVVSGQKITIPFYGKLIDLMGLQLSLSYDMEDIEVIDIKGAQIELLESNRNIKDTKINISWSNQNAIEMTSESALFMLECIIKEDGDLMDMISIDKRGIRSELYNENLEVFPIQLQAIQQQNVFYRLYDATPNPFDDNTSISIDLPSSKMIALKIRDAQGRVIYSINKQGSIGKNTFNINDEQLHGATGILYYTISTDDYAKSNKMIKLKK